MYGTSSSLGSDTEAALGKPQISCSVSVTVDTIPNILICTNVNNAGKSAYKVSASYSLGYATDEEDVYEIAALVFMGGGV